MTKKEMFARIATVNANDAEIVEFCNKEIELLDARKASKRPSKTQIQNAENLEVIKEVLAEAEAPMSIAEIKGADARLVEFSSQKMSALLKKLVDNGSVVKSMDKKKAYFALV